MVHITEALRIAKDGKPHDFVFVAKGDKYRPGGYFVSVRGVVSSDYHLGTINITEDSGEVRKFYKYLMTKLDGKEIFL